MPVMHVGACVGALSVSRCRSRHECGRCMQMAIHISPHKAKEDDRGMVIVGGALALGARTGQTVTVDDAGDVLDQELQFEEDAAAHSHSGAPHACMHTHHAYI